MRLADYVVQRLEAAGIEHVFTVCGGGSIFLDDALRTAAKMKYVCCHHEQAAAMAAEGYARVRNSYGCAVVTSGPGGTNAITGVAGAWLDHVPVVMISGQVFRNQMISGHPGLRTLGVQEINIADLVGPITKYAEIVFDPADICLQLDEALFEARNQRPGPVWLDIPADVQNAKIEPERLHALRSPQRQIDLPADRELDSVRELLKMAQRPLLHVGQGIRLAGAQTALREFMDLTRIPVVTARNGNDLIASDDPLYVGRPGTFAQRGANFAVQTCDLYIAVGTRLSLAQTGYNARDYARRAKIVMVDVDRAELDKDTVPVHLKIHADALAFLNGLNHACREMKFPDWSGWLAKCKAWQAKYPPVSDEQRNQAEYVNSYHLIDVLSDQLGPDDVVVTDMGFAFQNTHQAFRIKQGQRLMTNCGLAPMGWGLPAAIGAAIGSGRRVILITGDGGLMMNVQELATVRHHWLPIKIFVLNNGGYLTMRQSQAHAFDGYMGSDKASGLSFPDFQALGMAHGLRTQRISHSEQVSRAVESALGRPGPEFIEVMMDPEQAQIPKSINRREPDGTIRQTAIEDAWPYLPREDLEREISEGLSA